MANVFAPVKLVMTEVDDPVKIRLISKLIKDISGYLQKKIKYLQGFLLLLLL